MAGGDDFADGGGSLDIGGLDEGDAGDAGSHPAAFPRLRGNWLSEIARVPGRTVGPDSY